MTVTISCSLCLEPWSSCLPAFCEIYDRYLGTILPLLSNTRTHYFELKHPYIEGSTCESFLLETLNSSFSHLAPAAAPHSKPSSHASLATGLWHMPGNHFLFCPPLLTQKLLVLCMFQFNGPQETTHAHPIQHSAPKSPSVDHCFPPGNECRSLRPPLRACSVPLGWPILLRCLPF